MRKLTTLIAVGGAAIAVSLWLIVGTSQTAHATNTSGKVITDHALFTTGGGDAAVGCKANKSFTVYITVQAAGGGATFDVLFIDDSTNTVSDSLPSFELGADETLSIAQAAGGTPDADTHLVVSVTAGTAIGWMSLSTQNGASGFDGLEEDYCRTYTTEALAIADD